MDGVARQVLAQSPKGDEIWPPLPRCPENRGGGGLKIWRATKGPYLVLNLLPDERLDAPMCLAQASVCLNDGALYLGHRKGQQPAR